MVSRHLSPTPGTPHPGGEHPREGGGAAEENVPEEFHCIWQDRALQFGHVGNERRHNEAAERLRLRIVGHDVHRDDARRVFCAMAAELGPAYLQYTLDVLRSALQTRGYPNHVYGFTLNAVIRAVTQVQFLQTLEVSICSFSFFL